MRTLFPYFFFSFFFFTRWNYFHSCLLRVTVNLRDCSASVYSCHKEHITLSHPPYFLTSWSPIPALYIYIYYLLHSLLLLQLTPPLPFPSEGNINTMTLSKSLPPCKQLEWEYFPLDLLRGEVTDVTSPHVFFSVIVVHCVPYTLRATSFGSLSPQNICFNTSHYVSRHFWCRCKTV
uniref:Uncharacterized protein TCIL3000_3_2830 n=1 Tax=Trypanosoma congolense (strain IL3000) TaxID=1068625 RepID=G0UKE5_TRYCI|nr:unnamed protein product [Trypanosoma congolense IL3000]